MKFIYTLFRFLRILVTQNRLIMANLQDVKNSIATLQTTVETKSTQVALALETLNAVVAQGQSISPDDAQALIDQVNSVSTTVEAIPTA